MKDDQDAAPGTTPTNEPISRTVMTTTILHPTGLDPADMSHLDLAAHLAGDFLSERTSVETTSITDEAVDAAVADLGGSEGYFRVPEPEARRVRG